MVSNLAIIFTLIVCCKTQKNFLVDSGSHHFMVMEAYRIMSSESEIFRPHPTKDMKRKIKFESQNVKFFNVDQPSIQFK